MKTTFKVKKYILVILTIFLTFSIVSSSFAKEESYIEKLLDLNYWVEKFNINNLEKISYIKFYDSATQKKFDEFRRVNEILKNELIRLYKNWNLDYNSINSIIVNYNNFIYHTNKMFLYKSIKEIRPSYSELNYAIEENYTYARGYYFKVKNIVKNNLK